MFQQYPDEIDTILLDTSICLGNIKSKVIGNNIPPYIQEQPQFDLQQIKNNYRFNNYKDFFNGRKRYNQFPERFSKYSNEFYSRMNTAPPFAVDFFFDLQRDIRDLSIEELKIIRESVEKVPDIIKSFMPQDEILKRMRDEDSINREMGGLPPYYRIAQDRFIKKLSSDTSSSINYKILQNEKLRDIARKVILEPSKFGFRMTITVSYQFDYPFTNWIANIPDIMLNYYNCYIDMINRLIDLEGLKRERLERERLQRDRLERDRLERDRLERDRLERDRLEGERLEKNCPSKNIVPIICKTKKDFFKQSLIFHPDKNSGCSEEATEKFNLLQNMCSSVRGGQSKLKRNIKTKKTKIRMTKKQKIILKRKQKITFKRNKNIRSKL